MLMGTSSQFLSPSEVTLLVSVASLLFCMSRCPRPTPDHTPQIRHFSQKLWFVLMENGVSRSLSECLGMLIVTAAIIVFKTLQ